MNWMSYFLEASLFLGVCYAIHELFLKNVSWLQLRRLFLLATAVLALVFPLLSFELDLGIWPKTTLEMFDEAPVLEVLPLTVFDHGEIEEISVATPSFFSFSKEILLWAYLCGFMWALGRFLLSFVHLISLVWTNPKSKAAGMNLVFSDKVESPFSFFRYVFLPSSLLGGEECVHVLNHERTHVRQFHSFDLLILELIAAVFWFNPFIYRYRKSLCETHEFLADRGALDSGSPIRIYQRVLIECALETAGLRLTSGLRRALIKRRILMLTSISSRKTGVIRVILALISTLAVTVFLAADAPSSLETRLPATSRIANPAKPADRAPADVWTIPATQAPPAAPANKAEMAAPAQAPEVEPHDAPAPSAHPKPGHVSSALISELSFSSPIDRDEMKGVTSHFGERIHPLTGERQFHQGVDLAAKQGTPVHAVGDGMVQIKGQGEGRGKFIVLVHQAGVATLYSQLAEFRSPRGEEKLTEGKWVRKGDVIGTVGSSGHSTGPHLHFELMVLGKRFDPTRWINF